MGLSNTFFLNNTLNGEHQTEAENNLNFKSFLTNQSQLCLTLSHNSKSNYTANRECPNEVDSDKFPFSEGNCDQAT